MTTSGEKNNEHFTYMFKGKKFYKYVYCSKFGKMKIAIVQVKEIAYLYFKVRFHWRIKATTSFGAILYLKYKNTKYIENKLGYHAYSFIKFIFLQAYCQKNVYK